MLLLKEVPDTTILKKFANRYAEVNIDHVIQFLTFLKVGSDLSLSLDRFLAQHGLLQSRWWVLILLMREEEEISSPSALSEKIGVSRATMTGLLDGLVREGLVTRIAGHSDRRMFRIQLTQAGQEKLDEVMPEYYRRVGEVMSVLTTEEGVDLSSILVKLKQKTNVFE